MTLTVDAAKRLIHQIVDRRIDARVPRGVTEPIRGQVTDLFAADRRAMVQLRGSTTAVPVTYPSLPVLLAVGDQVIVDRGNDGWLIVSHVLGRDLSLPTSGPAPTPATPTGLPSITIPATPGHDQGPDISAAAKTPGMTIYLPDPTYINTTGINIAADNVRIVGRGGSNNPAADGSTTIWGAGAVTFDSSPGLPPQIAPSPGYSTNGGGLSRLIIQGASGSALGLRIVTARNLVFSDVTVRGHALEIWTDNHGTPSGGTDIWDHVTGLMFERVEVGVLAGVGIKLDGNTYSCAFENCMVGVSSAGGVGIDIYRTDDLNWAHCRVLTNNATAIGLRMNGANYGVGGNASFGLFTGIYFNGIGRDIVTVSDGMDKAVNDTLFLGLSEIDGETTFRAADIDAGSIPRFVSLGGYHNLRMHPRWTATFGPDDFATGTVTTGTIGSLGWTLGGGTLTRIAHASSHPGILNLATGAGAGTLGSLYTPNDVVNGGIIRVSATAETFDAEFIFRLNTSDTDTMGRVGFGVSPAGDPPTSGVYLEKLYADTEWYAVCRNAGVQTRAPVGLTVTAAGWVHLRIKRQNDVAIGFDVGFANANGNDSMRIDSNVTGSSLLPFFQVRNQAAANKSIDVDFFQLHYTGLDR